MLCGEQPRAAEATFEKTKNQKQKKRKSPVREESNNDTRYTIDDLRRRKFLSSQADV